MSVQNREVDNRIKIIGGSSLVHLLEPDKKWSCSRKLAYQYLGIKTDVPEVYSDAMKMGHILEPEIIEWFNREHNVECYDAGFVNHPKYEFIGGHPDGIFGDKGIIEVKTANQWSYWTMINKGIYHSYQAQLTLYMGITKRTDGYFILCNSEDLQYKKIIQFSFDDAFYQYIVDTILEFVDQLTIDNIPDRTGKRKNGLQNICSTCEFVEVCSPKCCSKKDE